MTALILNLTNHVLQKIVNILSIIYISKEEIKINPEKPAVHLSLGSDTGTFKAAGYHGNKVVETHFPH